MTTFVAVVQEGGFTAAARHLSLSPATVTQQIQDLENRIGARLLQRTTRKCALTEAGQAFYERATKILDDVEEADAIANEFHATSRGMVRLNTSPTLCKDVSALVAQYAALHPETSFDLTTTNRIGGLIDDRIDVAIRDDAVAVSSLIVRRLACAEWTACASPGHVARYGLPVHPAELAEHNCLVYARDSDCDEWQFTDDSGTKSIHVSGSLRSNDPHVLRTAALADQGLLLLPDAMVSQDLLTGRLVRVLNGYNAEQATVRAVYPSRRQLSLKVRTFLDFAAKAFGTYPQMDFGAAIVSSQRQENVAHYSAQKTLTQMAEHDGAERLAHSPDGSRSVVVDLAMARTQEFRNTKRSRFSAITGG
jgi:DNA-binding transcriptional LysR family regulator